MQTYDEMSTTKGRPWVPQESQDYVLRSPNVERNDKDQQASSPFTHKHYLTAAPSRLDFTHNLQKRKSATGFLSLHFLNAILINPFDLRNIWNQNRRNKETNSFKQISENKKIQQLYPPVLACWPADRQLGVLHHGRVRISWH